MLTILCCAILPAFLLIFYIYLRDRHQREPLSQILRAVFWGVGSAGIALFLETVISVFLVPTPSTWLGALWNAFLGAAIPEEAAKLLVLYIILHRNPYFDERFDGIVYACCVGMGFAGMENILYLFGNLDSWESVAISRAIFAVPGHFLFGVAMGYFYSKIHFRDMNWMYCSLVFVAPVMLHGMYDGLLFMQEATPPLSGILLICFYGFCFWMFRLGRKRIKEQFLADERHGTMGSNPRNSDSQYGETTASEWSSDDDGCNLDFRV